MRRSYKASRVSSRFRELNELRSMDFVSLGYDGKFLFSFVVLDNILGMK